MAKKMNCRQLREQQNINRQAKYAAEQAQREREKKEAEAAAEKEQERQYVLSKMKNRTAEPENDKKSLAKAAGVKSVFAVGDAVYMTSFGRGNDAVLEKKIVSDSHESINKDDPAFTLTDVNTTNYKVLSGRVKALTAVTDNPVHHGDSPDSVPTDMLGLKKTLEEKFYGRAFDSDNIHIQLIYNILDIEKILAQYSTNAVYALNNLFRAEETESEDFVGSISSNYTFDSLNEKNKEKLSVLLSEARTGYFGNAFYYCVKDKDTGRIKKDKSGNPMTRRRSEKNCYDILALIGSLRQWSFHGNDRNDPTWLYHLEDLDKEFLHILDELYDETIGRVNHDFVNNNKVNILILNSIFGDEALPTLIREYYDFLVTKKYKNIGFSIKKLREIMVEDTPIKEEKYDSVRSKLYKLLDFIIWHGYLYEDAKIADELVNGLRGSLSNEDKDYIYCREANRLWKKYKNIIFNYALPAVDGKNIRYLQNEELDEIDIGKGLIKESREVSYFTKLMYLLTLFIDGKEINDLLTTLINKFDNIRSFNETMESLGLVTSLVSEYSIFEKSDVIFRELTELNSFARMCSIDITAKRVMFCDAIDILGIETDMTDDELASMIDKILCLDANGQPVKDKKKKDSGLRNFIASNVIDSTRFKYLIRYGNSKKIRTLANCETAVRFVLKGIPDEQIERYYESCRDLGEKRLDSFDEKRAYLAGQIKEMSFEKIEKAGSVQKANVGGYGKDSETKRRYQAVIRLYLTVMYLMLKNLVNVNSRYVMGFHCVERDSLLYGVKLGKDLRRLTFELMGIPSSALSSGVLVGDCDVDMAENAGNRHLKKKRWYGIIFDNLKHSEISVTTGFRNTVAHLNAIRNIDENIQGIAYVNNYFELYHYIIQRALQKNANNPGKYTAEYLKNLDRYGTYSKDFVKAYCTPMAYNLVRYKNLTIDGQFDKNYRPEEDKDKELAACGVG